MDNHQPSPSEQRMLAVQRLKRAASLPRMKDGRRPPMHPEAVSEGEKAPTDEEKKPDAGTPPPQDEPKLPHSPPAAADVQADPDPDPEPEPEPEPEADTEDPAEGDNRPASPATQPRSKRRSRSRSRSRGSKDFKGKTRANQSPTPVSMTGDSSQDDSPVPPPAIPLPLVFSPIPHFALQRSQLLRSPTPTVPESYVFYPGAAPGSPMLPSLEAIQRGLFRSNSAAGAATSWRMAFQRSQAGDGMDAQPSNKLGRNNTIAGGERSAARLNLFTAINSRIAEAEQGTFAEENRPTSAQRRRRRRSRRASVSANTGTDDPGANSTTPNTPLPQTPSLPAVNNMVETHSRSGTPAQHQYDGQSGPLTIENEEHDRDEPRPRSVLVEEEDEEQTRYPQFPVTPQRNATPNRIHNIDPPPNSSIDSEVPVFLSHRAPSRTELFPSSPFTTPLKEKTAGDEDEVLYHADTYRTRTPYPEAQTERETSWIADPEYRIPVHDEELEEDDQEGPRQHDDNDVPDEDAEPSSNRSSNHFSPQETYETSSTRNSTASNIVIEAESYQDSPSAGTRASPASSPPPAQNTTTIGSGDEPSPAPNGSRRGLDVVPLERVSTDFNVSNGDLLKQVNEEPSSPSTWERMMNSLLRTHSGRRSRSNSIVKRELLDTTANRESGNSLTMSKPEPSTPIHQSLMQSPSASASITSFAPYTPTRGAPSPMPPATQADLHKYLDAKLFPFPGILEQRRVKGPTASASVPDVANLHYSSNDDGLSPSFATSPSRTPEMTRERKLSHQASDTRLREYFNISKPLSSSSGTKLPMSLPAVRQWLTKNKNGKKNASISLTTSESKSPISKKTMLADFLRRKESELGTDWEDISTPTTSTSGDTLLGRRPSKSERSVNGRVERTDMEKTPKAKKLIPPQDFGSDLDPFPPLQTPSSSIADPQLSITPDPMSSVSDYAAPTSESSSTTSSRYSLSGGYGTRLLQRLEEGMTRNSRTSFLSSVDDPPRKLILSSAVLQVVSSNTVKDRLLYLFHDVLVIAKPVSQEHDTLRDASDKRCLVKSVVALRDIRLGPNRGEHQTKLSHNLTPRSSLAKTLVLQFAKDPDQAVAALFTKAGVRDDPALLGQLLFRSVELDRTKLGEYLSRRSSKSTLKAYLDCFGFVGLRVDQALRVFLLSLHVPPRQGSGHSPLEYLLDQFSGRWYEANAKFVAYDKDLAIRLVRALVQLNELLHAGIAEEPGSSMPVGNIPAHVFVNVFRKVDPRYLVSDEHLEDLYHSIRLERLSQARCSSTITSADQVITIKRSLPTCLTYKVQSDPIILRISQPDPQLTIQLYGQDLVFDPPLLSFAKSSEASFRVMGTSLGQKTMIMCRSGPNALKFSGLPLGCPLTVERAFMRNTFQIAFINHLGFKRRYMFSVDDPVVRNEWVGSLRRRIEYATASASTPPPSLSNNVNALDFFRAAQRMSFRVLHETLTGVDSSPTHRYKDKVNELPFTGPNGKGIFEYHEENSASRLGPVRSKSRSKVYYKHAGKNESEANSRNGNSYTDSYETDRLAGTDGRGTDEYGQHEGPTWTARELEIQCQQNSILATVSTLLLFTGQEQGTQPS